MICRSIITGLMLFFFTFQAFPQDWNPFPRNQKTWFLQGNEVNFYLMDSIRIRNNNRHMYFLRNLNLRGAGSCYQKLFAGELDSFYGNPNYNYLDSLTEKGDTILYRGRLFFLPGAVPGQSWNVKFSETPVSITCDSIIYDTFCGLQDSVKIFSVKDLQGNTPDFRFRLSKNYGFTSFIRPFMMLIFPVKNWVVQDIIGLTKNGIKYGYHPPGVEDYFPVSKGDVLSWKYKYIPYVLTEPEIIEYYRDTILNVIWKNDSVTWHFDRRKINKDGKRVFEPGKTISWSLKELRTTLEVPPNWVGFGENQFGEKIIDGSVLIWKQENMEISTPVSDTITILDFEGEDLLIDTSNCTVGRLSDVHYSFTINSNQGITGYCISGFSSECVTLRGSRINGVVTGNIKLTGIGNPAGGQIGIWPNPSSSYIKLKMEAAGSLNFGIYSIDGRNVTSGVTGDGKVQLDGISPGSYFIRVNDGTQVYFGRFTLIK